MELGWFQRPCVVPDFPEAASCDRVAAARHALQDALDYLREQRGLSRQQIIARLGPDDQPEQRILTPDANPTLDTLLALFDVLGVTAELTFRPATALDMPLRAHVLLEPPIVDADYSGDCDPSYLQEQFPTAETDWLA